MFKDLDQFFRLALASQASLEKTIAAGRTIGVEANKLRDRRMRPADIDGGGNIINGCVLVQRMTDRDNRCAIASAHARGAHHPYTFAEPAAQPLEQLHCPGELAAEAIANAQGQWRRWRLVLHDDVEMRVERGDLIDLDQRQLHLLGERRQVACIEAGEMVLQQVQVLDQQVPPPLALAEQCLYFGQSDRVDLPPLREIGPASASRAGMYAAVVPCRRLHAVLDR